VSQSNVIPFRKRPPSEIELEVYLRITRHWNAALKQMMFPEHYRLEQRMNRR